MKKINAFSLRNELLNLWENTFSRNSRVPKKTGVATLSLILVVGMAWLGTTFPVAAQGTPVLSSTAPSAFTLNAGTYGSGSTIAVTGEPFTQAWKVTVTSSENSPQNVTLAAATSAQVNVGDTLVATFYYRRNDTTATELNMNACFEQLASPYTDSVVIPLRGRQIWREISVPFIANATYAVGAAKFYFQISTQKQEVEISGVTLTDYGQASVFGAGSIDASSQFSFNGSADATETHAAVTGNPFFTTGTQIAVTTNPNYDAYVNLTATVPQAIGATDTLVAIFWVRDADAVTKNAVIGLSTQNAAGKAVTSYVQSSLIVDGNWKEHIIPFSTGVSYTTSAPMSFTLKCSAQLQTVEYGGLELLDLGTGTNTPTVASLNSTLLDYPGRLISDSWRTAAATRIAAYRMGNFNFNVTGSGGAALSVPVTVAMQKHLFGFGTEVKASLINASGGPSTYQSTVATGSPVGAALFNKAVFESEMKWVPWETVPLGSDPKTVTTAFTWLHTKGIYDIRGQNLIWPDMNNSAYVPTDVKTLSATGGLTSPMEARVTGHIDNEVEYFDIKQYMSDWDVCNEPYENYSLLNALEGTTGGGNATNDAKIITAWMNEAVADDAYPYTFVNDNGVSDNATQLNPARGTYNYNLLQDLIADGAPVDGFGFESHFGAGIPTPPLTAKAIFDQFAGLTTTSGQPLLEEVTEFDQDTTDETMPNQILQADYLSDYMTMVFSEPNFDCFVMWGFWDGDSWISNAPIYNLNWSLKPSGEAWMGLVYGQWWTNATVTTSSSGTGTVNGYLGRYAVTASYGGITKIYYADLPIPAGATLNVQLTGTSGTSHVWLHEANRGFLYAPLEQSYDPESYDTTCVSSLATSGDITKADSGFLRIDTEAVGTVNIWMRVKTPAAGGAFWVGIDGPGSAALFNIPEATSWTWVKWGQTTLAAGTPNSIWLWDGIGATKLDQVLITDDLSFTP